MEKSVAEKIFDSVHRSYDKFLNFATFSKINKWQETLINATPNGKYILDIGTGTGEIVKKINQKIDKNSYIYALDISFNMLKVAKSKIGGENILFLKSDALKLPFKEKSLDNVYFSLVFRHLPALEITNQLKYVLKKDGYVSILEIAKPRSKILYNLILLFTDKMFRPIGRLIFSKQEWDYFVESIKNSITKQELLEFFKSNGFTTHFYQSKLLGLIHIAVLKKQTEE
ncbi:methyltransferase, UbiE/COQ5 family [Sulfurihydrogenibium azorense Az-Fu1]|jgi:demethylmenaquinone methyltransferase/2-methoxy-6-polyprenyl-1,4-benzoquinol methylase|uniref:Methyltransferase, UbiE/COQ5 family n=1 Tax=Sulfurihydrogenibium azorense (strain DSM 15241 / OCM 825 / Az-Fu1) TaxID=204536 RepID=C1DU81_SULAA|nr:class I SAM-dependent methyltransferase [Sulfurihydrogenibium azorense]ACN98564.1 methyltransferase, UbiE/COQ5 family [Sulfurihydrogenibium azorense Az-Fu1]